MFKKKRILILIGSTSSEHDVSIVSGINVYNNIPNKYSKDIIYLNKENIGFIIEKEFEGREVSFPYVVTIKDEIEDTISYMQQYDLVFPVLHGKFGEDGQIQKILEENNVKYIGSDSYTSNICFDKGLTKKILEGHDILTAKSIIIELDEDFALSNINIEKLKNLNEKIKSEFGYPIFVKPARSGSSVGVSRVEKFDDLPRSIIKAFNEDNKILIEEAIDGNEVQCGILEINGQPITSLIGKIKTLHEFYTYDSKYVEKGEQLYIFNEDKNPELENLEKDIKDLSKRIFGNLGCKDLARIDFFIKDNKIVFNEINTIPGFSKNSMYPWLLIKSGYPYEKILEILIENNLKK